MMMMTRTMTWWIRLSIPEAGQRLILAASLALVPPCTVSCHHSQSTGAAHQTVTCLPLFLATLELSIQASWLYAEQ